jgi:two-component system NtrC family response regulator
MTMPLRSPARASDTRTSIETPDAETPQRPVVLIVEDHADIREQLRWGLEPQYDVLEAPDRPTALGMVREYRPALITLDLGLPPDETGHTEGFAALSDILGHDVLAKVIVVTGNEDRAHALTAIRRGAYDFLKKPIDLDVLRVVLQRAHYLVDVERENRALQDRVAAQSFHEILGASPPMQQVFKTIRRVAGSDIPVLIMGESGTGKELVARAIHQESNRKRGPFIAINCGAIPDTLLESELFGHEKGAFTGAHVQRKGRVESAQGGTLFLDEIGELSPPLQVKLLRFLQAQVIERIGGREEIPVDTRVVAATNMDLQAGMKDGRFREDLFYRLNVVSVRMPPLRERGQDLRLLAKALLNRFAMQHGKRIVGFTAPALAALDAYSWPGNIRELENRINRAVVMAEGSRILPEDLQLEPSGEAAPIHTLKHTRSTAERELLERTLAKYGGNITKTAKELGVSRPTVHQLMAKYGFGRAPGSSTA